MKYWKLTAISILTASVTAVWGQTVKYNLPSSRCSQSQLSEDSFGRICITCGSQLYAFAPDGALQFAFGRNSNGAISSIDATNPMKIAVYFASANLIYLIDNHGNHIGAPIDLGTAGIFRASSICMTGEGNIWLFDTETQTLRLVTPAGAVKSQSSDISKFVAISNPDSVKIAFSESRIILSEGANVAVFSSEGAYISSSTVSSGCRLITLGRSGAYYLCGDTVQQFHAQSLQSSFVGRMRARVQPAYVSTDFFITNACLAQDSTGHTPSGLPPGSEKTVYIRSGYLSE